MVRSEGARQFIDTQTALHHQYVFNSSKDHTWSLILGCQVINSRRLRDLFEVDGDTLIPTLKEKGGLQCKTRAQWVRSLYSVAERRRSMEFAAVNLIRPCLHSRVLLTWRP